ncbi:DnaB-like helicase C-terminal domain-containing protein [Sulfobacillus thermosulfidooxidans]|uniref:DnaB-like helicase C-terminal domain-containing protein n=1 Tax=Sulfobacillus thermosulfidooxidans TaxID=28034 RepID=UPI0002EFB56A|nr:DnaB-like helicase C-terminal domain-containing protein [Sulfobacillus thermosulfidooxidans]
MEHHEWSKAEEATLALAVVDPGFRARVLAAGADVFTNVQSRRIWDVLQQLSEGGQIVDAAAVELAVGYPILAPPSGDYFPLLLEHRLQRQLQRLGHWLLKPRRAASTAVAAQALRSLQEALEEAHQGTLWSGADVAQKGLESLLTGPRRWLASGMVVWDAACAGWGPDDLVLVGARPSQGKTALGLQMTWRTAETGRGAIFCSVEMGPAAIGLRAVCQASGWTPEEVAARLLDPQLEHVLQDLSSWPWHVVDANGAGVADLQAAVARAELDGPRCDVVVVDYLQLLRPARQTTSREQDISRLVEDLKSWARRDHRLIVALSQLSRKVEDRIDRVPTLADLRESGALEQTSDGVVLIHHLPDAVDLIVAKNRNGPTGAVRVSWDPQTMRFFTPEAGA